jgi:DNA-binding NarL/FixJ family response regulator
VVGVHTRAVGVMIEAHRRPTRRQLEVLRAYIRAGSVAAAAYELGISETTVRQHLSGLYRRTGCVNAAQAAFLLGRMEIAWARGPAAPPPAEAPWCLDA